MNSPDERIWRTVIVSVGAASISRGGTVGPMAQVARKSFQGFSPSPLFYRRVSTRGSVLGRLKLIGRLE